MIAIQICSFFVNEQASKPFQDQRQKARKRVGEKDVCAPSLTRVGSDGGCQNYTEDRREKKNCSLTFSARV